MRIQKSFLLKLRGTLHAHTLFHILKSCKGKLEISLRVQSNMLALHFFLYVRRIRSKYEHKKLAMNFTMTWHKSDTRVSFNSKVYHCNLSVWTHQKPYVTSILRVNLIWGCPDTCVRSLVWRGHRCLSATCFKRLHRPLHVKRKSQSFQMKCNITVQDSLNWSQVIF